MGVGELHGKRGNVYWLIICEFNIPRVNYILLIIITRLLIAHIHLSLDRQGDSGSNGCLKVIKWSPGVTSSYGCWVLWQDYRSSPPPGLGSKLLIQYKETIARIPMMSPNRTKLKKKSISGRRALATVQTDNDNDYIF